MNIIKNIFAGLHNSGCVMIKNNQFNTDICFDICYQKARNINEIIHIPKSMHRLVLKITMISVMVVAPFSIWNFLNGNYGVGATSAIITVMIAAAFVSSYKQSNHFHAISLYGIVPTMIGFLYYTSISLGVAGTLWCYPAIVVFYFILPERKAWVVNALLVTVSTVVSFSYLESFLAIRILATQVMLSLFSAIFIHLVISQQKLLHQLTITDPLTGLLNRSLLERALIQARGQCIRFDTPMTLVALDIDNFKRVNDKFGHSVGDEVLKEVANYLKVESRESDMVFRIGGEEFLILLYNTCIEEGALVANKFRDGIANLRFATDLIITASLGVSSLKSNESPQDWFDCCDRNLYEAKNSGRNLVVAR